MNLLLGLLLLLPFLTVIISIHELGHFWFAKRFDFKVEQYFVGFGPRLWSTRRGETEIGVKWILGGGYVRIAGMNPYETIAAEDVPRSYGSKPIWQRAIVIAAGPLSHFVVAALIFASLNVFVGDYSISGAGSIRVPEVSAVQPRLNGEPSPAAEAGLRPGDVIVSVDGVTNPDSAELAGVQADNVGDPIPFVVLRDGEELTLTMTPERDVVDGVPLARIGITIEAATVGPVRGLVDGVRDVGESIAASFEQITRVFGPEGISRVGRLLFTSEERRPDDAVSVVGIGRQVGATTSAGGWVLVLLTFAFMTVFIGLINLVPLPPFDGGHLAVLVIEWFRGKAVDMRRLIPISAVVIAFFGAFVAATVILDIAKPVPTS